MITPLSPEYPENLRNTLEPPRGLYINGKLKKRDSHAVAIVGSRTASKYGIETAREFSYQLAKAGVTIISGLARGIDTEAHKAALAAGGRTIAVLGSGLDMIYPPENEELSRLIVKNGALVTEFAKGTKPLRHHFLQRNKLIAGLSLAVLIVEGRRRSGTLSTARHAAELGREVFAVPGNINSPLSEAPNWLIGQGAQIALSPLQIADFMLQSSSNERKTL